METEIAWAGGFFEGEGSISRTKSQGRARTGVVLAVSNTDVSSLERLLDAIDAGTIMGPYDRPNRQPTYRWQIASFGKVLDVLSKVWPYLSPRRQQRALQLIEDYAITHPIRPADECKNGHKLTESNSYTPDNRKTRVCRTCRNTSVYNLRSRRKTLAQG